MKEIELPDGTIAEFPDNMPDSEIESVLQKQFSPSVPRETSGYVPIPGVITQNPGATRSMISGGLKGTGNLLNFMAHGPIPGIGLASDYMGIPQRAQALGKKTGLLVEPATRGQRAAEAFGEIAMPALLTAPAGGAGAASAGVRPAVGVGGELAAGMLGGAGAASGAYLYPQDERAKFFGGLLGAMAPAAASMAARRYARGGNARQLRQSIDDFERAVGEPPTLGEGTGARRLMERERLAERLPIGGRFTERVDRLNATIGQRVDDISQRLARGDFDSEAVGKQVHRGLKSWTATKKAQASQLYDALDNKIAPDTMVDMSRTADALNEMAGSGAFADILGNPTAKKLLNRLPEDRAIPFGELRKLRSLVGRKLSKPNLVDDFSTGELKQLYGAMSDDVKPAAQGAGALDEFERANKFWRGFRGRLDDVESLAKKNIDDVLRSIESGAKKGPTRLRAALKSMDEEAKDVVVASVISRLGEEAPGAGASVSDMGFSLERFITRYRQLNPKAREVLFSSSRRYNAQFRRDMDRLVDVMSKVKAQRQVLPNPSGTAAAMGGEMRTLMGQGGVGAGIGYMVAGTPGAIVGGALGAISPVAKARLLSSPSFVKWAAQATRVPAVSAVPIQNLMKDVQSMDAEDAAAMQEFFTAWKEQEGSQPE